MIKFWLLFLVSYFHDYSQLRKTYMSFFSSFKIFPEMRFGPDDLCESREDIIKDISFLSVGVKEKVFVFV